MSNDLSCNHSRCPLARRFSIEQVSNAVNDIFPGQCPFQLTSSERLTQCEPHSARNVIWACEFNETSEDFHDPKVYIGPRRDTRVEVNRRHNAALQIFGGLRNFVPNEGPVNYLISNSSNVTWEPFIVAGAFPLALVAINVLCLMILLAWGICHPLRKRKWLEKNHIRSQPHNHAVSDAAKTCLICLLLLSLVVLVLSCVADNTTYSLPSCVLSRLLYESAFGSLADPASFEGMVNIEPIFDKSLATLHFKIENQSMVVDLMAALKARWGPITYTSANLRQMQYQVWLTRDGVPQGTILRHDTVIGSFLRNSSLFDLDQATDPISETFRKAEKNIIPQSFTDSATALIQSGRHVCAVLQNNTQELYGFYDDISRALIDLQATLYGSDSKISNMLQLIPVIMTLLLGVIVICILAVILCDDVLTKSVATAFNLATISLNAVAASTCVLVASAVVLVLIYTSDLCDVVQDALFQKDFYNNLSIGNKTKELLNECLGYNYSGQISVSKQQLEALQDLFESYKTLESQIDTISQNIEATAPHVSLGEASIEKSLRLLQAVKDPALLYPSVPDSRPWLYATDPRIIWASPYVANPLHFEDLDPLSNELLANEWQKAMNTKLDEFPSLNYKAPWSNVKPGIYTTHDISIALSEMIADHCPDYKHNVCASFDVSCQGNVRLGIHNTYWIPEEIFQSENHIVSNFEFIRANSRRTRMLEKLLDCLADSGSKKTMIMFAEAIYWIALKELLIQSDKIGLRRSPEDSMQQLSSDYTDFCPVGRRCPLYVTGSADPNNRFTLVDHSIYERLIPTDFSRAFTSNVSQVLSESVRYLLEVHPATRLLKSLSNLPDILNCRYGRVAMEESYATICKRLAPSLVWRVVVWLTGGFLGMISLYIMVWHWHRLNIKNYQKDQLNLSTSSWPRSP